MSVMGVRPLIRLRGTIVAIVLFSISMGSAAFMPSVALAQTTTTIATTTAVTTSATSTAATSTFPILKTNKGIEAQVRAYFTDAPIMAAIASCESQFRQFSASGKPLDGGSGGMIGIFQISSRVHTAEAQSLGMNIYTVKGNMAYAEHLYEREGTVPWLSSLPCWGPLTGTDHVSRNPIMATSSVTTAPSDENEKIAELQSQVTSLQTVLINLLMQHNSDQNS